MVKIKQRIKSKISAKTKGMHKNIKSKKLRKNVKNVSNDYGSMSVDDFLSKSFQSSDSDGESLSTTTQNKNEVINDDDQTTENLSFGQVNDMLSTELTQEIVDESDDEVEVNQDEFTSHKESLAKLKDTDPEFYQFLKDNDKKLLEFNISDSESENGDEDDVEVEQLHQPTGDLEVASDESDFEGEEEKTDKRVITLKILKAWQRNVQTDKTNKTIICLTRAFHAAVLRVSSEEDDEEPTVYQVDGSAIFNGVIQLCVLELGPAIRRYLGLKTSSKQAPHKCKKFVKIKTMLRGYFTDLLKILSGVTSTNILNVLLKHLHYMSPMIVSFMNVTKPLLKKLVNLWGTSDESVRVISFLCILRITNNQQQNLLDIILKMMYMTYVKNSKFVSMSTLPGINFMRRSLVEMFALDVNVSYQHIFLYVRQLAIHLRNAITVNKKENIQAVYNWQFVNSLKLWGTLFSVTCNKPQLQSLIYPFVQICLGTIKLISTAQYYPLRFHIVQILIDLSKDTKVFIPILPFLLEILITYDFNKKHQKVSMKPLDFTCILRLSKSQLSENGFKDAVIDSIYAQLLKYLASKSYSLAFPDLSLLCIIQVKLFLKKCTISNYCRKMRQLQEKVEQNNKFIVNERKNITFNLKDVKQIDAWEVTVENKGTPLNGYYDSWNKLHEIKKNKQATNNEAVGNYNLPTLKKKVKRTENKAEDNDGKVVLFPSDSDSDDIREEKNEKPKRGKRGGKNVNKKTTMPTNIQDIHSDEEQDIVQDLLPSDW